MVQADTKAALVCLHILSDRTPPGRGASQQESQNVDRS